jgi:excisionase family DNA binding protein
MINLRAPSWRLHTVDSEGERQVNELWLSAREVARMMERTPQRVYQMIERGQIPARRIGTKVVIPRQAFQAWQRQMASEALASCGMELEPKDAA